MAFQLSAKDRELLISKQLQERIVGDGDRPYENGKYGTLPTDFLLFQLYDTSNNLIESKNLPIPDSHNDLSLGIYPAGHIKNCGYDSGTFQVRYQFLRKLAGDDTTVLLRTNSEHIGEIYDNLQNIYITDDGKVFLGTKEQFEENDGNLERLILEEYKYQIDEISPSRTEVRLKAKNIKGNYKEEFYNLQESIRNLEIETYTSFQDTYDGYDANTGGPPASNNNASKLISIGGLNFGFTSNMVGGTLRISDVYKVGEEIVPVRSEVNLVTNSSGEQLQTNDQGNVKVGLEVNSGWNEELHYQAVYPIGWTPGFFNYSNSENPFNGTHNIGYHAHWVRGEGYNGGTCMKFPDINAPFTAEQLWPNDQPNRMLRIQTELLPNLLGQGINAGDLINISFWMKSTVLGKGVRVAARFPQLDPEEPKPTLPLILSYAPEVGGNDNPDPEPEPEYLPEGYEENISTRAAYHEEQPLEDNREYPGSGDNGEAVGEVGLSSAEVEGVGDIDHHTGHWKLTHIREVTDTTTGEEYEAWTWSPNLYDEELFGNLYSRDGVLSIEQQWEWQSSNESWIPAGTYGNTSGNTGDDVADILNSLQLTPTTDPPINDPTGFVEASIDGAASQEGFGTNGNNPPPSRQSAIVDQFGLEGPATDVGVGNSTNDTGWNGTGFWTIESMIQGGDDPQFEWTFSDKLFDDEYSKKGTTSTDFQWTWSGTNWQPTYIAPNYADWYSILTTNGVPASIEEGFYIPVINTATGENALVEGELMGNGTFIDPNSGEFRSSEGQWIWNGSDWDNGSDWEAGWYETSVQGHFTYKIGANGTSRDVGSTIQGEWERHEVSFEVPETWRKDLGWNIVFYGHAVGQETQGVTWVDDVFCDFTYTTQATTKNIYEPYISKITEVYNPTSIKVEKSFEDVQTEIYGPIAESTNPHITLNCPDSFNKFNLTYTANNPYDLRTYLKDGDNLFLTTNFKRDTINVGEWPHSIVYKLYEPLPDEYEKFDEFMIVKEMLDPFKETIRIVDFVDTEISNIVLKSPDLNSQNSPVNQRSTVYKTETEILTDDVTISEKLKNEFISQSFQSVELNTDYSRYENFVNFSSIEKRIRNFKSKLELIESYTESSASLLGISGSNDDLKNWKGKINDLKNNFDSFEKYMYVESSSYSSGSLGIFYDNAWPKTAGSGSFREPYILAHTTSSVANSWFSNAMTSASNYDIENLNRLSYQLPDFIKDDSQNEIYLRFTDMIGQHFDLIWEYINALTDTYDRREKLDEGISKELLFTMAKSLGWEIPNSKDLVDLPRFAYGVELTGSLYSDYSAVSDRDISREMWSRIINNMPFFLKNKGTIKALKGLINIYGIPSTILRVKEYGGPDLPDSATPQYEITRKFTKALDFRSSQYIKTIWSDDSSTSRKPDAVEFRFRAATGSNQILAQKIDVNNHDWFIRLKDNGSSDNYGTVSFMLSSSAVGVDQGQYKELTSSAMPVYDGDFYSVMVRRTSGSDNPNISQSYALAVGKYDSSRSKIHLYSETTMDVSQAPSSSFNLAWTGSGDVYIGGQNTVSDVGIQFSGSIMEYRHWTEVLQTSSFKNHIGNPKAYDGNSVSSSYQNLVLRYSFNDNKDLSSDTDGIRDVSSNQTTTYSGSHSGFSGNFFRNVIDEQKTHIPSIGGLRRTTKKIRIEDDNVLPGRFLSATERATQGVYDTAPLDSNKVGIFFAPTDVINTDIINSVADLKFDDYLGDPRDLEELSYRGLRYVANNYWKKYTSPNNFWDYIRIIKYYDQSMFPQIKKMIPARAKARVGVLVEPNIFERPKIRKIKQVNAEDVYYSASIKYDERIFITSSFNAGYKITDYDSYNSTIKVYSYETGSWVSSSGEYVTYEASGSEARDRFTQGSIWPRLNNNDAFYSSSTITFGDFKYAEVLQPVISGSRIFGRNQQLQKFYSTVASHSDDIYHSSSWKNVDLDNHPKESTARFNLFYAGVKNTNNTTIDGGDPFEYIITAPTKLVTQESGDSSLKTGEGKVPQFKTGGKETYLDKKEKFEEDPKTKKIDVEKDTGKGFDITETGGKKKKKRRGKKKRKVRKQIRSTMERSTKKERSTTKRKRRSGKRKRSTNKGGNKGGNRGGYGGGGAAGPGGR